MDISNFLLCSSSGQIGAAIAARRVSSVEVTRWYLDRIAQLNGGANGLNAVRQVSPRAMQSAAQADREAEAGRIRGPLHGVPYLVKDNIFTGDGLACAAGAKVLSEFVPRYAATLVTRLTAAGAVLLGKTNLTEFADFVSDVMPSEFSGAGGVVRNPLGGGYGRGQGSSVGSAAAVRARLCAFAIGSETQNSIQAPATFSGIVGFKPTVGKVSRHGVVPLVPSQDSPGPLTVCVEDAALVFAAMAGCDPRDTATLALLEQHPAPADTRSLRGVRIGVPRKSSADQVLDAESAAAFDRVLAALSRAGARITDSCDLPSAELLLEVRSCVFRTEFKAALDALLESCTPCGLRSLAEIIAWNREHPDAIPYGQSLLEAANATAGLCSDEYVRDRRRDLALSLWGGIRPAMNGAGVDVLLSPLTASAKCTGKAGAPVIAIPAGQDVALRPFGITLFAEPGADYRVLSIARSVEEVLNQASCRT